MRQGRGGVGLGGLGRQAYERKATVAVGSGGGETTTAIQFRSLAANGKSEMGRLSIESVMAIRALLGILKTGGPERSQFVFVL